VLTKDRTQVNGFELRSGLTGDPNYGRRHGRKSGCLFELRQKVGGWGAKKGIWCLNRIVIIPLISRVSAGKPQEPQRSWETNMPDPAKWGKA